MSNKSVSFDLFVTALILTFSISAVFALREQATSVSGQNGPDHKVCYQGYKILQACCPECREIHPEGGQYTLLSYFFFNYGNMNMVVTSECLPHTSCDGCSIPL